MNKNSPPYRQCYISDMEGQTARLKSPVLNQLRQDFRSRSKFADFYNKSHLPLTKLIVPVQ